MSKRFYSVSSIRVIVSYLIWFIVLICDLKFHTSMERSLGQRKGKDIVFFNFGITRKFNYKVDKFSFGTYYKSREEMIIV